MLKKFWAATKNAATAFKRTTRSYSLSGDGRSSFWRTFQAEWTNASYSAMAQQAVKNPSARRAIDEIKNRVLSVWKKVKPVVKKDDGSVEELSTHPALELLEEPNDRHSGSYLKEALVWQWYLSGEFFLRGWRPQTGPSDRQVPRELWIYRGDDFSGWDWNDDTGRPEGVWLTEPNGVQNQYSFDQVLHARNYNPLSAHRFHGLPVLVSVLRKIDQQHAADRWNQSVSSSGGRAPFFLMPKGLEPGDFLDKDTRKRTQENIDDQYQKASEHSKPWVLSGMFDVIQSSYTPEEAAIRKGYTQQSQEIIKGMGLSPVLLGSTEDVSYSNLETSEYQAYRGVVLPLVNRFLDELNNWLMPQFAAANPDLEGAMLTYDKRKIDALDVSMKHKVEALSKLVSAGIITRDEARMEIGYEEKGGMSDMQFVPGNMLPLDATQQGGPGSGNLPELANDIEDMISGTAELDEDLLKEWTDEIYASTHSGDGASGKEPVFNGV